MKTETISSLNEEIKRNTQKISEIEEEKLKMAVWMVKAIKELDVRDGLIEEIGLKMIEKSHELNKVKTQFEKQTAELDALRGKFQELKMESETFADFFECERKVLCHKNYNYCKFIASIGE